MARSKKGAEAEEAASHNDMRMLYRIVRDLTGAQTNTNVPVRGKDGKVLLTEREQSARWVEHFNEVLNQPEPDELFSFDNESDLGPIEGSLEDFQISETAKAIRKLKNNKAAGLDEIPAELLKQGGEPVTEALTELFNKIWHAEEIPEEWREGIIIPLSKKGCLSDCNNWRGITLLSVPGKVFCSMLFNRLKTQVGQRLREEQAGFRSGRSCTEQILILRNIIEQSRKWQKDVFVNFVDFKKAFDSIHRDTLWKILQLYGIPQKYINIFQALYRHTRCCIRINKGVTDMFDILTGVRQGCILSPFLFLIVIDFLMRRTVDGRDYGIPWGTGKLTDLDFADNIALISNSSLALQSMTNELQGNAAKVGLRISAEKTKAIAVGNTQVLSLSVEHKTQNLWKTSNTLAATYQETVMQTMTYIHG